MQIVAMLLLLSSIEPAVLKQGIAVKQQRLKKISSKTEKAQVCYELAQAYYQDQEIEKSFCHFLEALKNVDRQSPYDLSDQEKGFYQAALVDYLALSGFEPQQEAERLLASYDIQAQEHPEFLHLNFLLATAYANLGKYDLFFEKFYKGFPYLHDSFIAFKTQGILYLKLFQRTALPEEKKVFHELASHHLDTALERNSQDASLYKILISLAKDADDIEKVRVYLKKMAHSRLPIARGDICLYVKEAVSIGEYDVAQAMIDRASEQYAFSRSCLAAQEYLNQNKG